jgi:hypothetical protein
MHDWGKTEAQQAAVERHSRQLRQHAGYPTSDGLTLRVICACGTRSSSVMAWQQHLETVIGSTVQRQ